MTVIEANTLKTISEVLLKSHKKDLASISLEVGLLSARRYLPLSGEDFVACLAPSPSIRRICPLPNALGKLIVSLSKRLAKYDGWELMPGAVVGDKELKCVAKIGSTHGNCGLQYCFQEKDCA